MICELGRDTSIRDTTRMHTCARRHVILYPRLHHVHHALSACHPQQRVRTRPTYPPPSHVISTYIMYIRMYTVTCPATACTASAVRGMSKATVVSLHHQHSCSSMYTHIHNTQRPQIIQCMIDVNISWLLYPIVQMTVQTMRHNHVCPHTHAHRCACTRTQHPSTNKHIHMHTNIPSHLRAVLSTDPDLYYTKHNAVNTDRHRHRTTVLYIHTSSKYVYVLHGTIHIYMHNAFA